MAVVKTAISLEPGLLAEAEAAARDLKTTRSGLIARALADFLARRRADAITAALDEVYSDPSVHEPPEYFDAMLRLHREAIGPEEDPW
jgi:hypothetical protein